uniref:Uncharacterized protein n=1 Tax=Rhizophora mucronata TaxID=61149 RepID=A0A2P2LMA2_RHIMU
MVDLDGGKLPLASIWDRKMVCGKISSFTIGKHRTSQEHSDFDRSNFSCVVPATL